MATIQPTITKLQTVGDDAHVVAWTPLANGDDGAAIQIPGWADRSIQITGTFGVGGTVVFEGSNDGVNYTSLRDPQGSLLSFTAAGLKAVLELTRYVRARVTAGDGTTSITATFFGRRG